MVAAGPTHARWASKSSPLKSLATRVASVSHGTGLRPIASALAKKPWYQAEGERSREQVEVEPRPKPSRGKAGRGRGRGEDQAPAG